MLKIHGSMYRETYCTLSRKILHWVQPTLVFTGLRALLNLALYAVGDKGKDEEDRSFLSRIYYTTSQYSCKKQELTS